ncbi:MAG: response regulator, partial [Bacteroidaceae bacterium]|nr:response regulator [Bacteroidaceae bacterium]
MTVDINPSDYKILVVDDVMPNVLLLKVMLSNEKFNIITASNGEQAIDLARREKPDLMLLDVMMPGMT